MTQSFPPAGPQQFAHAEAKPANPWKLVFRIVRWTTYAFALVTLVLVLHKAPPPPVETSPQAAARAEQKFADVERAVASGQPATLRMDETELNPTSPPTWNSLTMLHESQLQPLNSKALPVVQHLRRKTLSRCAPMCETSKFN